MKEPSTKKKPVPTKTSRARSAPGGVVAKAKQPAASKPVAKAEVATQGKRPDYQAMERDYRTGSFTDQELADKFGRSRQAITKMAKAKGWKKDLSLAVRQATKASLIAEEAVKQVAEQVAKGGMATLDTVLAAAETNKQVILSHRHDIAQVRKLANAMLNELTQVTVAPQKMQELLEVLVGGDDMTEAQIAMARGAFSDLARLPTRILSVQRLTQAMTRLQAMERTAFGMDDEVPPPPDDGFADLSDEELNRLTEKALERHNARGQH